MPTLSRLQPGWTVLAESREELFAAAESLDDLLFTGPMVLIDADNRGCGIVSTSDQARAALACGQAVTWAAQVRPGVVALDLDLDHKGLAREIVRDLGDWAAARQLWSTSRESGGGRGRMHFLVAAGSSTEQLRARVEDWRVQTGLSRRQLDLRTAIRPLTAPHRRTGYLHLPDVLHKAALATVEAALGSTPVAVSVHRSLDAQRGRPPANRNPKPSLMEHPGGDRSRSGVEFAKTLALYNSGVSESDAWACVSTTESKSKERGRHWWQTNIWHRIRPQGNQSVKTHQSFDLARTVLPTVEANRHKYADLHPRTRNVIETVMLALIEKLQMANSRAWVPVSERDLYLCTGIARRTIRRATAILITLGIMVRREAEKQGSAHTYQAGPATITSLTAPPILTPPPSRWLPHCPHNAAHTVASFYLGTASPGPQSTRQAYLRATATTALRERGVLSTAIDTNTVSRDQTVWLRRLAQVTEERDSFHEKCRANFVQHQRRRALAAERRRRQWWSSLSVVERRERSARWRDAFEALPQDLQQNRRDELRERRCLARAAAQEPLVDAA